uniref:Uncharacterized protein n=1 Tax=Lotus japonicus TaxID=34305 RepID=I3SQB3_LOTJA|nr:unknown [Lotus japonicus]
MPSTRSRERSHGLFPFFLEGHFSRAPLRHGLERKRM